MPGGVVPGSAARPRSGSPYPLYPAPYRPLSPLGPSRPSVLDRRWPGPRGAAHPTVLGATAVAALIGAVSIPLDRPGVGWLVAVLAGTAALAVTARSMVGPEVPTPSPAGPAPAAPRTAGPVASRDGSGGTGSASLGTDRDAPDRVSGPVSRHLPVRLFWAAATVALASVGTVRAAGWMFVLCLLTAAVTSCLTVVDARSVRAMALAVILPPVALVRSAPWVARGLHQRGGRPGLGRAAATVAVSIGLLTVFGALFSSADAAFAGLVENWLPELSVTTMFRWVFLFVVLGAGLVGAAYLLVAPVELSGLKRPSDRRVRRLEWALPVALLDALFAAFVGVQVTVLFGGARHVLGPSGPTYAEYARGGFWQLLMVTALTLLVIAGAARWAPRDTTRDRLLIRLLLGALVLLSLVVVGSALNRMNLYTQEYGATRLRLLVAACELWLGLVFVLILVAGIRIRAGWLPQLVLATAVLALLGLATVDPDRQIAQRNVDRYLQTGRLDRWYLANLSADAVPALNRLPAELRSCVLIQLNVDLTANPDDWRGANLGRIRARDQIDRWSTTGTTSCPPPRRGG